MSHATPQRLLALEKQLVLVMLDDRFSIRECCAVPNPLLPVVRLACAEGGTEMDIIKLLQSTGADALDRIAYNLKIEHPQNGFYDTLAFKRIRSKELASTHHARMSSAFQHKPKGKRSLSTSNPHSRAPAQRARGGPKPGGIGKVQQGGQKKGSNGVTKSRSVKR